MDQLLTSNVATNLYWFGRHLERVESALIAILHKFDVVIDTDPEAGRRHFNQLGIALEYENASQFLQNAIFGDHDANLAVLMCSARENAIICRAQLDTDAFGETIKLAQLFERTANGVTNVDYQFIDDALSLINEIWGIMSRGLIRRKSDHFIRLGKLVEKVDLHLRHGKEDNQLPVYLNDILLTAQKIAPETELSIYETDEEANLDAINALLDHLVSD